MSLTKVSYSMITGSVINVRDYGATGDGSTDDTAAIQSAIDAGLGKRIFFPKGVYKITDTLDIGYASANTVDLFGEGLGSVIQWNGANSLPVVWYQGTAAGGAWYANTVIERLNFVNNTANTGVIGIRFGKSGDTSVGVGNTHIRNCQFSTFGVCVQSIYESDEMTISDNRFNGYTLYGVQTEGSGVRIINNHFQNAGASSYAINATYSAITISGNVIQANSMLGAIYLANCGGFNINANYSESGAGASYFVSLVSCQGGYISGNTVGGFPGATLYLIDANCKAIDFGPNHHTQSGGFITALINATAGATGLTLSGQQYTDGAVSTITGSFVYGYQNNKFVASVANSLSSNGIKNVLGPTNVFVVGAGETYLITATISNAGKDVVTAIVQGNSDGSVAHAGVIVASTPGSFTITTSGATVQFTNTTGVTETYTYNYLRIK